MNAHIKLKSNKKQQNTNRKHKKKQKSRKSDSYKNFFIKLANTYIYIIYEYITTIKSKLKRILNASRTHRQKEQDNNNFS